MSNPDQADERMRGELHCPGVDFPGFNTHLVAQRLAPKGAKAVSLLRSKRTAFLDAGFSDAEFAEWIKSIEQVSEFMFSPYLRADEKRHDLSVRFGGIILKLQTAMATFGTSRFPGAKACFGAMDDFRASMEVEFHAPFLKWVDEDPDAGRGGKHLDPEPAKSADEAVQRLGDEWATYKQLSDVTGKSESAIRSAISRAKEKKQITKEDEQDIPDSRPGMPRIRFRIRAVWPHI